MHPITKNLFWEYLARNRWSLLACPILASIPTCLLLSMLRGIELSAIPRELLGFHIVSTLSIAIVIIAGVILTQGSPSRLYLKPLSSIAITNFFFWGGALLVAGQVALLMILLRWVFSLDWPIAGPVLFCIVFWAAIQPFVRTNEPALWWYAMAPAIVIPLFFWLMMRHGLRFPEGGVFSASAHPWTTISGTDLLIASATLLTCYVLTNWRITQHRCGRTVPPLLAWTHEVRNGSNNQRLPNAPSFRSVTHAFQWFDFRSRTSAFAMIVLAQLVIFWGIALACSLGNKKLGWDLAFSGTTVALISQWLAAIFTALSSKLAHPSQPTVSQNKDLEILKTHQQDGATSYLYSLPIAPPEMARAMLRSSALAAGIATAAIALSLMLLGGLSQRWTGTTDPLQLGIGYWQLAVLLAGGSMLVSFALINRLPLLHTAAWRIEHWIGLIGIASLLLSLRSSLLPLVASLAAGICIVASVYLTLQSVRNRDTTRQEALMIWLLAIGCGLLLSIAIPAPHRIPGGPILLVLVAAAINPFFTTASEIREIRTN